MRKRFAIISCAVLALTLGPAGSHAFEQQSPAAAPPAAAAPKIALPDQPKASLDDKAADSKPAKESKGIKLPGLGRITIPKMNFGLDLMYGAPETKDTELGFSPEQPVGGDDVTIMGKVKRRF